MALMAATVLVGAASAQVTVIDPWVRGTVEGQTATAAYMTLASAGGARLVSITSPVAARCSVHQTTKSGNMMRMRQLESLPIPAGGSVELREGRDHVMLEGLKHALKRGEKVALTLKFVDSNGKPLTVDVRAPVLPLGATIGDVRRPAPKPSTR